MQRENPESTYSKMMQFMTQWIIPTMGIAAQQGCEVDIPTATRIMAEYAGFENLNQFYKTAVPQILDTVPYTMVSNNRPTGTSRGKSTGQMNDSMGATDMSRMANMNQQQARAGGQSSPSNKETL